GRDGCRVQVAVDVLGDPIDCERGAEPPEHVVAGEPPPTDVEVHGRQGLGAMEIVEEPEELLLLLRLPLYRESLVSQELLDHTAVVGHGVLLSSSRLSVQGALSSIIDYPSHLRTRPGPRQQVHPADDAS